MADETFTKADIDAAVERALEGVKSKNTELMDEVKKLKSDLRRTQEITPETLASIEAERDKAVAELAETRKQVGTLTKERDAAAKALEIEQSAYRAQTLTSEIRGAMNKVALVPGAEEAIEAFLRANATVEMDQSGNPVTKRGDRLLSEFAAEFFSSDASNWARAAPMNSGGGAPGSGGAKGDVKTITRGDFDAMDPAAKMAAIKSGVKPVDA